MRKTKGIFIADPIPPPLPKPPTRTEIQIATIMESRLRPAFLTAVHAFSSAVKKLKPRK